jgi:phosphatidylethanolamine/phosphatidyl-N-methylethanolamine N-methyltransferase
MARKLLSTLNDTTLFVQEWLQAPLITASVTPSSRFLSNAMAQWANPNSKHLVLELGPGTGAVTQALIRRGVGEHKIACVENNPKMADVLSQRFPKANILSGDAREFDKLLQEKFGDLECVEAVISSLPLKNFPAEETERLAAKIHSILRPRGKWVQYSYNLKREHPKGSEKFELIKSDVVWFNIPPARLSVYQKNAH